MCLSFSVILHVLQMCELEKVARLEATVLTERDDCPDSPDITVGVSLEQGAPVLLLFSLSGDNSSYSETREMNTSKEIFQIGHPIQGMEDVSKMGVTYESKYVCNIIICEYFILMFQLCVCRCYC